MAWPFHRVILISPISNLILSSVDRGFLREISEQNKKVRCIMSNSEMLCVQYERFITKNIANDTDQVMICGILQTVG